MTNKEPLDKKRVNCIDENGIDYGSYNEEDVKSSLSNLKKRLKEEIEFLAKHIDKIFSEEIGEGLLEKKE